MTRRQLLAGLGAAGLAVPAAAFAQSTARVARIPISLREDRIWVPVRIGQHGPFQFILDTGATMGLIRRRLAAGIGLRRLGSAPFRGVGGGERLDMHQAQDVSIGGLNVGAMTLAAFQSEVSLDPDASGTLAAMVLTTLNSELDLDSMEWRLHPDSAPDRSGYELLGSEVRPSRGSTGGSLMFVEVMLDGQSYRLQVDTASPSEIMLGPEASRRSGLWADTVPFAPHRRSGLGGVGARARLVRAREARLGSLQFERPLVSLTDPSAANFLEADGLLGIGLVQLLNLSVDVDAKRLWAKRNGRRPRPEEYGYSGIWLEERRGRPVISVISPGSPGAEAGLEVGDELLEAGFSEWVRRLSGSPGDELRISYRRGGGVRTATLTLRRFL